MKLYKGLHKRDGPQLRYITIALPREDAELIEAVAPGVGVFSHVVHATLYTICNELRATNTTTYEPDAIYRIIRRLAVASTVTHTINKAQQGTANRVPCPKKTNTKTRTPKATPKTNTKETNNKT